jgi:hypothetical protein
MQPKYWIRQIARKLLGWAVIPYVRGKNDRLAAVFIAFAMNDWQITKGMMRRKRRYWRWCKWWGCT